MEKNKYYIGKVIYNEDPTFTGRCKVRVFGLFDGLDDDFIPWFAPVNSGIFSTKGGGSISVPKIDDIVRVKFSNNDLYSGEYTSLQCLDPELVKEIKDDYLGTHVLLFDAEAELIVSYQQNTGFKIYHKGSHIILDPTGMIQLKHSNDTNVIQISNDKIVITTASTEGGGSNPTSTIDITSGNSITISADTVNVNAKHVNLGNAPVYSAVKGEVLQDVLRSMAAAIDTKYPMGLSCSGLRFGDILSNDVKLSSSTK